MNTGWIYLGLFVFLCTSMAGAIWFSIWLEQYFKRKDLLQQEEDEYAAEMAEYLKCPDKLEPIE